MPRTIKIEVDRELHSREPSSELERINWETLDTAWKLIREGAARLVIQALRETAQEQGVDFPATDEELFAKDVAEGGTVRGYADIAPSNELAAISLANAFEALASQGAAEVQEGFDISRDFRAEVDRLTGE